MGNFVLGSRRVEAYALSAVFFPSFGASPEAVALFLDGFFGLRDVFSVFSIFTLAEERNLRLVK